MYKLKYSELVKKALYLLKNTNEKKDKDLNFTQKSKEIKNL